MTSANKAVGEFHLTGWDERPYKEDDLGKLTHASVTQDFTGDIEGKGRAEWLMCYRSDGTADFVGLHEIEGTIDDQSGSFVVTSIGLSSTG